MHCLQRGLAAAVALGLLVSCGDSATGPSPQITELPRDLTVAEVEVIDAANHFGFHLLRELAEQDPDKNLFISPLSASMALGMTLNGAAGSTWDGMLQALSLQGLDQDAINDTYASLIDLLIGLDPAVTFQLANSIWAQVGFPILPDFLLRVEEHFDATVESVDFGDPVTVTRINDWVKAETGGRIEEMIEPPLTRNVVMILLNAIYFNGEWTEAFHPDHTHDDVFTRADGSTRPLRLMQRQGKVLYLDDTRFQAVELPYGAGAYAMTVILPRAGVDLAELVQELDAETWGGWTSALQEREITLELPRFTLEWNKKLNDALKRMGMEDVFDASEADFSRLTPEGGIWVDEVKQKTFLEVNEEGTEAAATTAVIVVRLGPPSFRVDRPFLLAIRERLSGTVLFLGAVHDPDSA